MFKIKLNYKQFGAFFSFKKYTKRMPLLPEQSCVVLEILRVCKNLNKFSVSGFFEDILDIKIGFIFCPHDMIHL